MRRKMNRTREEILSDIDFYTKLVEINTKQAEERTKQVNKFTKKAEFCIKSAEKYTKWAEEAKQELKQFDEAQNEQN